MNLIVEIRKGCCLLHLAENTRRKVEAERYGRTKRCRVYRKDHYKRDLFTRSGLIEEIQVPRMEPGGIWIKVY